MRARIDEYFSSYTVMAYDYITKAVFVQKEAEGKYEKYGAA